MTFKLISKEEFVHWKMQIAKTHDVDKEVIDKTKEVDYSIYTRVKGEVLKVCVLKQSTCFGDTHYYKNIDVLGE